MLKDYLKMGVSNLLHRKMRSWLTMIGIFIGIASVVALISLGQGLQVAINDQFAKFGLDKLILSPGGGFGGSSSAAKITDKDERAIRGVPGVIDTMGLSYTSAKATFKRDDAYALFMSYPTGDKSKFAQEVLNFDMLKGRRLQTGDTSKAVLGYDYSVDKAIFPRAVQLYDNIDVNGQRFQVVGFYDKVGSNDDQSIYIPEAMFEKTFGITVKNDYKQVYAKTAPGADPEAVAEAVKKELRRERSVKEGNEDFSLQTAAQLMDSFNSILLIIQVVIVGIAAISLVVGGVGIMNTMYTAVVERTPEIGVMKAIGARNKDVLLLFLIESGLLGLVGGALGVIIGLGLAKTVEIVGGLALGTPYLRAWWSWQLILGALLFSFLVGAASGVAPAYQASKQKPVDALRYE